ncbi:MAG: response regulator [Colwellia sp.]|nr:response regulator [Colwellia sp.]
MASIDSTSQPSVKLFQAVLDALPFCVFWKDRNSIGLGCNQALADVAGLDSPKDYLGKSDYDLPWTKEEADFFRECDRRVMESGKAEVNIIESQMQSNGRLAWLETSKIPLTDEDGNIIGTLGAFHNITERKRLEDENIANQKLDSLATLSAGLAHDFNNVLMMILGNCQLTKMKMANGAEETEIHKHLDNIEKATSRASTLTNKFMSYSERGPVTKTLCNISKMLVDTLSFVQASIKSSIAYDIDNTKDALYADTSQIQQVIYNLIINASQASINNEEISVSLRNREIHRSDSIDLRPGKYFEISIKDYGIGISDVQKEEIFKPYFTTKENGHGLGLSACLTTVMNHNGIIHVESKEGLGSTFTVFLPVFMQNNEDELVHQEFSNELIYGSGRVLYIEDDLDTQATTLEMLQEIGYQVQCYSSLKPAISYIQEQPDAFDIVITDFIINDFEQGGAEILDTVRDIRPNCPVILITGYYKQLEKRAATSNQFSYIVQKPVSFGKFSQIINRHIKNVAIDCENRNFRDISEPVSAALTSIVDINKTEIEQSSANRGYILVVDDDQLVANFLKSYLTHHNYNVTTVSNGHLALEKLEKQPFDLMITDQSMPNMTGIELSKKVKILFPNTPIILSSGYGDEIIEQNIKNVGINHFHKKSSNPEELIEAITELL